MRVRDEAAKAWMETLARIQATQPTRKGTAAEQDLGPVEATRFFVESDDPDDVGERIERLRDQVWLWGTTLSMHISYLEPSLRQALSRGRHVRVLLIPPNKTAMQMSALRAGPPPAPSRQTQEDRLRKNLEILRSLAADGPGLEVRLIDYLAPYTLYAYDPGFDDGTMVMRLGSFHGKHRLRPTFELLRSRDGDWFDYFYEQFTAVWSESTPYDLATPAG